MILGQRSAYSWLIKGLGLTGDSLRVFVETVSQKLVGSDILKSWGISQSGCYDWGDEILERVGNLYFFSPSYCLCENGPFHARCYADGSASYQLVPYPCDTAINWLTVTEPSRWLRFLASPNPAKGHTFLLPDREMDGSTCTVTLFDVQGRRVREQSLTMLGGQPLRVELSGLPPGLYTYRALTGGGAVGSGKVAVER
jgi:hypothetical protein